MKFLLSIAFVLLLACLIEAQVLEPEEQADTSILHPRLKRATCDLLSKWEFKHTACAAHCLVKGFKGGWCNAKAICNCRK
ncbi:Def [Drosophila busckii]|uniref:Def n=1 Tax=Drosophila busckii TaxID=30019 RepID=A0A0M3QUL0_DROBS|nr:defensin [Drosophila busckii]ALC40813.1 Def [Drosophila busckii]